MEEGESTGGGPGGVLYKMLDDEGIKSLICIHALCWGTSCTAARFKALYPAYAISKSGITTWVKHFSTVLAEGQCPIKQSVGKFEALTPNEIPLRYIYEIRQRILHKRNVLRYKIFRMDIPRFVKEVLEDHGLMEKFGQWAGNEVFCDRLFNVSSKMNMELRHGAVKEFFENNPKWFIDWEQPKLLYWLLWLETTGYSDWQSSDNSVETASLYIICWTAVNLTSYVVKLQSLAVKHPG